MEIIASILECAKKGSRKTHIMSRAYISYTQSKLYFELLETNGLLEYEPQDSSFRTTYKGFAFLRVYEFMNSVTSPMVASPRSKKM